jgi:trans-2,3-dihydro-3-hydroxyanthranilate isomerase
VRIFTPTNEIPFAGHPNVGTAWAVAEMGELYGKPVGDRFAFDELAGKVDCQIRRENGAIVSASIAAPQPLEIGQEIDIAAVAACASLSEDAIETARHRPQMASVGLNFVLAELKSLDALGKAKPNATAFAAAHERYGHPHLFSLFMYTRLGDNHLRTRMFAPLNNIPEDPATGSASAAAAAFLAHLSRVDSGDFIIEQGVEMGRPSRLELSVCGPEVRVGGPCVPMMRGTLAF